MKVYISGPMTGLPESNLPAFHAMAAKLREAGHEPINPADNGAEPGKSHEYYMRRDLAMLNEADALVVLPGWQKSQGACVEVLTAFVTGRPVYQFFPMLEYQLYFSAELLLQVNTTASGGLTVEVESLSA